MVLLVNETKLVEVTTDLNDKDFLNQLLTMEIDKISTRLNYLLKKYKNLPNVNKYNSIKSTKYIMEKNFPEQNKKVEKLKKKEEDLLSTYKEIQEIESLKNALRDYTDYQTKLKNSITTKDGIMYSSIEDSKVKLYNIDTIIRHLFIIKNDNNLKENEIKAYIEIVKNNLTTFKHFKDDSKDEILIIKLYKNPNSYQVEALDNISSIKETENYYYDSITNTIRLKNPIIVEDNLTEREKNAFYNEEAYKLFGYNIPKEKIKVIKGV